jgi:hypothetical protein
MTCGRHRATQVAATGLKVALMIQQRTKAKVLGASLREYHACLKGHKQEMNNFTYIQLQHNA